MKTILYFLSISLLYCSCVNINEQKKKAGEIIRYDRPEASILKGVNVPADKDIFFSSGLVAPVINADASPESYERYGNTKEQSMATLKRIEETLQEAGYQLADVVQMHVYLAPDAEGVIHWQDWFDAYGEFFNNETNPTMVARTTLGVHSLARPDLLVEVEVIAVK